MDPNMNQQQNPKKCCTANKTLLDAVKPFSRHLASLCGLGADILFQIRTLYLFTSDQILDTVIPGTIFGGLTALSGSTVDLPSQDAWDICRRLPWVSFWLWLVVLQFCVQNQRSKESAQEDLVNKPWRPVPSGRITYEQAGKLLAATNIFALVLSSRLNVVPIFVIYLPLITWYNDYGGGDYSGIIRNLFCGAGFSCYFSGALSIMIGSDIIMSSAAWKWTAVYAFGIVASTIQTQEFRDQTGDVARGRGTLVTELGRKLAFWTVFMTVTFWSVYTPFMFFAGNWKIAMLPVIIGGALLATAAQAYRKDDVKLDRKLYKIWSIWVVGFCPLPFFTHILA